MKNNFNISIIFKLSIILVLLSFFNLIMAQTLPMNNKVKNDSLIINKGFTFQQMKSIISKEVAPNDPISQNPTPGSGDLQVLGTLGTLAFIVGLVGSFTTKGETQQAFMTVGLVGFACALFFGSYF
jgi:hypothetical protein